MASGRSGRTGAGGGRVPRAAAVTRAAVGASRRMTASPGSLWPWPSGEAARSPSGAATAGMLWEGCQRCRLGVAGSGAGRVAWAPQSARGHCAACCRPVAPAPGARVQSSARPLRWVCRRGWGVERRTGCPLEQSPWRQRLQPLPAGARLLCSHETHSGLCLKRKPAATATGQQDRFCCSRECDETVCESMARE